MLQAFALLLLSQLSGEGITRGLGLPVPGPVIGLVLMAIGLLIAQRVDFVRTETIEETALGRTATGLLGHLSLLFVPAGVGIVQHGGTLLRNGVAIAVALVVSTVLALAVTAFVFRAVARLARAPETIA
jgi:holin-like protein